MGREGTYSTAFPPLCFGDPCDLGHFKRGGGVTWLGGRLTQVTKTGSVKRIEGRGAATIVALH